MIRNVWTDVGRINTVCVDSYDNGVLQGRLYSPCQEVECFASLSQFLLKMEQLLDETQQPQSYTRLRRFSSLLQPDLCGASPAPVRRGGRATFDLQVIFRQNTSWQGILHWREANVQHSFRSVLELVILMDSALRSLEGRDTA